MEANSDQKAGKTGSERANFSDFFISNENSYKPCDRNHSYEGCVLPEKKSDNFVLSEILKLSKLPVPAGAASVDWDKCKFNDIDEKIKKLKD